MSGWSGWRGAARGGRAGERSSEPSPTGALSDSVSTLSDALCLSVAVSEKIRVVRTCGYIEVPERDGGCVSRSGTHDVNVLYCSCKGNLCNAAPPAQRLSAWLLLSALPMAVLRHLAAS